jgi:hypothetical protein
VLLTEKGREDYKIQKPHNRNPAHVECKHKGDASYNRSNWDHSGMKFQRMNKKYM